MMDDNGTSLLLSLLLLLILPSIDAFITTTTTRSSSIVAHGFPKYDHEKSHSHNRIPTLLHSHSNLFLTFDLDDTLFPIGPVVRDANRIMIEEMRKLGFSLATETDFLMTQRQIRTNFRSTPLSHGDRRCRAIQSEMERLSSSSTTTSTTTRMEEDVHLCYCAWLSERNASAERNLFPSVLPTLSQIHDSYRESHNLIVAAITNGSGDPLKMTNTLQPFFDFTVSGEEEHIFPNAKPHAKIYTMALERHQQLLLSSLNQNDENSNGDLCWIHVGDDLANDVGASAACGAKAIWFHPEGNHETSFSRMEGKRKQPFWSTATEEELAHQRILSEKARPFIHSQIQSISDLPSVIKDILLVSSS